MGRAFLLVPAATLVLAGYVVGVADGVGAQPSPNVDVRRCENAAHEVPEFGGAYVAERGTDGVMVLHVWMTESDVAATEAALTALRVGCPEHAEVVIHDADYSYAQLSEWQRLAWTVPAVTLSGIDTQTNRLTVGVADMDSDGTRVKDALVRHGVPVDALALMEISEARTLPIVDHSKPVGLAVTLGVVVVAGLALGVGWVYLRRSTNRP